MIEAKHLGKTYKSLRDKKTAVDDISFNVELGKVTGFVGPNGAGKSTTMRLMLGLDIGEGKTNFDGKLLHQYSRPSKIVGALLEVKAFHPTRSARNHLKVLAAEGNIPDSRVAEVLDIVGLADVAKKGPGKFSLGMSQRLGIAAALLGSPKYLILDEPANGLDPEGIVWLREFIRDYAKKGNGVFISSHLLNEMAQMADNVVVIGKGRLVTTAPIKELLSKNADTTVFVRAENLAKLEKELDGAGLSFTKEKDGLSVVTSKTDAIGKLAAKAGSTVFELTKRSASLEEAILGLTEEAQEYKAKDLEQ
ncbi:MAG: export transporter ATP-binding protein [Candidatus Saccharibacteria bacterium]|nr:export transporter ATP-binding protein [Candidatus Saccharibacteria bacterium]